MLEIQGLDPMDHYQKTDVVEIDENEEIHERIDEKPQPSKRKRTDPKGVRHNVVANIRVIRRGKIERILSWQGKG